MIQPLFELVQMKASTPPECWSLNEVPDTNVDNRIATYGRKLLDCRPVSWLIFMCTTAIALYSHPADVYFTLNNNMAQARTRYSSANTEFPEHFETTVSGLPATN